MLGDTLTITLGGSGGTARVCSKINQDSYSSEYLARTSTDEVRVRVRHWKVTPKTGPSYDRHHISVTQTVFATLTASEVVRVASSELRMSPGDDIALAVDVAEGVAFWSTGANLTKLAGWES